MGSKSENQKIIRQCPQHVLTTLTLKYVRVYLKQLITITSLNIILSQSHTIYLSANVSRIHTTSSLIKHFSALHNSIFKPLLCMAKLS